MLDRLRGEDQGGAGAAAHRAAAGLVRADAGPTLPRRGTTIVQRHCRPGPVRRAGSAVDERRRDAVHVHQVLATLGYGDAIGHEVLGIQRVLRAAGYESDIFVETADPRLEDLTRDYRELVDASRTATTS